MALIRCPECSREVSSRAPACPGCGCPLQARGLRPEEPAWRSPHVWGRLATVLGAWLVTPWLARLVVALAVCVVAYFLFTSG